MTSFTISTAPIYRSFTVDQSSAIANIEIDGDFLEVIFQSNTERAYVFKGSIRFIAHICAILQSPDLLGLSLGSTIAKARKNGDLKYIEFPVNWKNKNTFEGAHSAPFLFCLFYSLLYNVWNV